MDALDVYLTQKGKGRPKSFEVAARRACGLSDVSTHGTVLRDCVVEGLWLIFTPIGAEDDRLILRAIQR
jgi:hypothetical protein